MRDRDAKPQNAANDTRELRPGDTRKLSLPMLLVAVLPLALWLVVGFLVQIEFFHWTVRVALLFLVGVASVICCFKGARILFARKTAGAVLGGVALIILNGLIAICSFGSMIAFWDEH